MRALAAIALLAATSPAHAESFVEVAGGLMTPLADDQWKDYVRSSPKLAARAGASGQRAGALLSIDWTPINTTDTGFGNSVDVSAHRFRFLIGGIVQQKIGPKLNASFRLGIGFDVAYVNIYTNIFGFESEASDTDVGLALEPAFGLWFDAGSIQIGGELALPISVHGDRNDNDVVLNEYTSLDLDLLFGVRFLSQ